MIMQVGVCSGSCDAAHHGVPPGTGLPLFPFPVSPLTPTVSTNCERGTGDTTTTTRLISAIVDIQQCTPSKKLKIINNQTNLKCPNTKEMFRLQHRLLN